MFFMEQDFTPEFQIRDEQFMNRLMKKISSSKREGFLKNIILHSCLFLTFGEYDKGTMKKIPCLDLSHKLDLCQPKVEMSLFIQSRDVPYSGTTGIRHG